MAQTSVHPPEGSAEPSMRWWQRPEVRGIFWIWLVLTVLGLALCWVPAWLMGPPASSEMTDIRQTMTWFTAASAPVAALVWAIMIYSLRAWRYRGSEPPPDDAPGFETNTPSVLLWTIGSALLTLFVFIWGLTKIATMPALGGLSAVAGDTANAPLEVQVTGNQWVWNFTYPGSQGIESHELVLPVNRPVNFEVTSNDVIHSFWIVEMGVKMDANPGAVTQIAVTPTETGTYAVRCAELCGILHAAMQTQARVVTAAEYDAWVSEQESAITVEVVPPAEGDEGGQ